MQKSPAILFLSLAAVPTVWFGGCLSTYAHNDNGELTGPAAIVTRAGDAAAVAAPVLDTVAAAVQPIPAAGEAASVATVAAVFADTFSKEIDARLVAIEAVHRARSTRSNQREYVGAAVGSTLSASLAAVAAFFAGQRRREESKKAEAPK